MTVHSGDELYGDDVTSGPADDDACGECGALDGCSCWIWDDDGGEDYPPAVVDADVKGEVL